MLKIDSLRAAIGAAIPEMKRNPENLRIWIERGAGRSRGTGTDAFAFTFQANVLLVAMSADIAVLAHAIFRWLRVNQPDLLAPGNDGFSFDADILDNGTADLLLQIQLVQNVTVAERQGGGYDLVYLPEPAPLFDDDIGLTEPDVRLAGVSFDDHPPPPPTR